MRSEPRAEEYRKIAEDCRRWAKQAHNEEERQDFLQMAQISLAAAAEYELPALEALPKRA